MTDANREPVTIDAEIVSETTNGQTRRISRETEPESERTAMRREAARADRSSSRSAARPTRSSQSSERTARSNSGSGNVRDQQRQARSSQSGRHANVTNSGGGGYRSSVTGGGPRGGKGKAVSWDSNGDGKIDLREIIAGVLRWFGSVLASPNTYALFFACTGITAGVFNVDAWIKAAYRSNHPVAVAVIMFVGFTGLECYHVISTMTPRSSIAKLVRAARKPDMLPTLDEAYVANANALVDDLQRQMKVQSSLPWFIASAFTLALEIYIVADPATYMGASGFDPFGVMATLFIVGGIYISCQGYRFTVGQILSKAEQDLVDLINGTVESTKTTKMS